MEIVCKIKMVAGRTLFALVCALCALCSVCLAGSAQAGELHALVIGTAQYERARDLANPAHDATAMVAHLQALGFVVHGGAALIDPDRAHMLSAFAAFAAALPEGARAVVFLAGHGLTHQGDTYLIPSDDATLATRAHLGAHGVPLRALTGRLAGRVGVNSLILVDACSANGLRGSSAGAGGSGDLVASASGSMSLLYAAAPGQTAADGQGQHSPFTQALLHAFEHPNMASHALFQSVSAHMAQARGVSQIPWMMQALGVPD